MLCKVLQWNGLLFDRSAVNKVKQLNENYEGMLWFGQLADRSTNRSVGIQVKHEQQQYPFYQLFRTENLIFLSNGFELRSENL
ncbi:hypothetical protein HanRHA438_Chr17g0831171 [Helianthus annuus]|nr:hypothetical protein HanHA300_Chr17g0668831 [Helianthus annuus]KAJ0827901.1 hypothetical protein HanRHA438_Chr17g0831171 [Helianthus annuus]